MADELKSGFPRPMINMPVDSDSQLVKVDFNNQDMGSRPSAMPKKTMNDMTIKHVGGGKSGEK